MVCFYRVVYDKCFVLFVLMRMENGLYYVRNWKYESSVVWNVVSVYKLKRLKKENFYLFKIILGEW